MFQLSHNWLLLFVFILLQNCRIHKYFPLHNMQCCVYYRKCRYLLVNLHEVNAWSPHSYLVLYFWMYYSISLCCGELLLMMPMLLCCLTLKFKLKFIAKYRCGQVVTEFKLTHRKLLSTTKTVSCHFSLNVHITRAIFTLQNKAFRWGFRPFWIRHCVTG
jgi:hypothetical protein